MTPLVTVSSPSHHCPSPLQAVLLLCKASHPALTLSDVFSEESLAQYLTICCRNWGGGTGEGQSPSVWLTAMESVVLEMFQ